MGAPDSDLHYQAVGQGPSLLFLHAFPLGMAMWDDQTDALSTAQVIRFDFRGFGQSPPGEDPLTMEQIAADAVAVLDRLRVEKAVVCGCSMGGYVAFAMHRRWPERIRALVLADTRSGADTAEARRLRAELAERMIREGASVAVESFLPKLVGSTTRRERPDILDRLAAIIARNPPRGIAAALAGLAARIDSTPTLATIRVPTLIVQGEDDLLIPLAEAEAMHRAIDGSRLTIIPGAGHLANLENPAAFNQALAGFLAEVEGGASY